MGGRLRPAEGSVDLATGEPVRQCAATRRLRNTSELIRFVAGPDGTIVPDLAGNLPGRGVWVSADQASVAAAIASKAFSRSLKSPVSVDPGLPAQVEKLLLKRALAALSLANKAGLVVAGFDQVNAAIERGKLAAVLHGQDAAAGGCAKLDRKFEHVAAAAGKPASIVACLTIEQMSLAMGRSNVVHAGLIHGGATTRLLAETERLSRYRTGLEDRPAA